jgi:hypothetical protein
MDKPKDPAPSLVVAWDVQRKNRAKSTNLAVSHSQVAEEMDRPGSLVDAILAKRKAAMPEPELKEEQPLEDEGYGEPLPELEAHEHEEQDISAPPKKLPFPTSRADAIRARLKAVRGF